MTRGDIVEPVLLNRANLARFAPSVQVPRFDPALVAAGIVHLGLGGFHRAHMARYTHNLMECRADSLGWGIIGAGLMPADRRMQESLGPQDNLYTLVERGSGDEIVTVIGSLADVVFAGESSSALLAGIDKPAVRIVSLTVTEHGYCLNRSTKRLDPEHPLVRKDLAQPEQPASAIGIVVEAYRRRMAARARAVHCAELRQHPAQRHRAAGRGVGACHAARSKAGGLDRCQRLLSEHDGRSDHAGDGGGGHCLAGRAVWGDRPLAGVRGSVHAVGDRGSFHGWAPGVGRCRGAVRY